MTRSTWPCGTLVAGTSLRGRARGDPAAGAGMPSARRWRCTRSDRPSTSTPVALICVSRTTPTRLPWPRRSPGSPRSPARGFSVGGYGVAGAKTAKSAGNLVLVSDLLKVYPAAAVRLLILDRQWDQDWDYSQAGVDQAAARLERVQAAAGRLLRSGGI